MSNPRVVIDREAPPWAERLAVDINTALRQASTSGPDGPNLGYNVVTYGADVTGTRDSAPGIQAAIDAAPSGSGIYFPPGEYIIYSALHYSDKALSFYSLAGPDAVRIRCQDCHGIFCDLTDQPGLDDPLTLRVRGITFMTNNLSDATNYTAIRLTAPDINYDGGESQIGLLVEDCIFDGEQRFDKWWPYAIYVRNISNNRVARCFSFSKANTTKGYGFVFSGHSTSCIVTECELFFNEIAIQQDGDGYTNWASEGLVVKGCGIKAGIGVFKTHSALNGEPQLQVYDTHINARGVCIYTINTFEVQISNCLLYLQGTALETISSDPFGVYLADSSAGGTNNGFFVRGTQIRCLDTPSGISRGVFADMSVGLIEGSTFTTLTRGIEIASGRSSIHVSRNNRYVSCTANVTNLGVSNTQDAATVAL